MIKKQTWVQIEKVILHPNERAMNLPDDTKKVPLIMWVKGYLQEDANIGDTVNIITLTNRKEQGKLVEANPTFKHNYGEFVPEILKINQMVKQILFGDANESL
ncbi:MAG: 2-amino-4-oxopentanoate thiolase subunit OrtA [Bacilli bacterium]|nr:2-amino-4-oxopentanoate thiolase subunit OrtA [Bacilli bacterium]